MRTAPLVHADRRRHFLRAVVAGGVALAVAFMAAKAQAQTRPPPPQDTNEKWVWTTLPALEHHAKIEVFERGFRGAGDDDDWRTLCVAPCGRWIAAGTWLRVNGDFRAGAPFELPVAASVDLAVKPRRVQPGVAILSLGGGILFLSAFVYGISTTDFTETADPAARAREQEAKRPAFYGLAAVGILGMATGLGLIIATPRTTVDLRTVGSPTTVPLARGFSLSPAGLHF